MILWNTKKLCDTIRSNGLSDNDKKNYLIVGTMLIFSMTCFGYVVVRMSALQASLQFVLLGTITILGLQRAFREYRPSPEIKTSYLEFSAILGVPLGFKFLLLSFAGGLVAGLVIGVFSIFKWGVQPSENAMHVTSQIVSILLVFWYYWHLVVFAKYISRTEATAS